MSTFFQDAQATLIQGAATDALAELPRESVNTVVTSPPYFALRDYGVDGQLGLEASPDEYVERIVEVFAAVRRVLRSDGTLWLNIGDSYAAQGGPGSGGNAARLNRSYQQRNIRPHSGYEGVKPKDMIGIPWRVAFALQADGWYLRSDIIWYKRNAMPETVKDRPTKAHEYLFLLAKSKKYYYDYEAIKEPAEWERWGKQNPGKYQGTDASAAVVQSRTKEEIHKRWKGKGKNKRTVWDIPTKPYKGAHFAVFPETLVEPCVLAGSPVDGVVLDPFCGSGTTLAVARRLRRKAIGIDLQPDYLALAVARIQATRQVQLL